MIRLFIENQEIEITKDVQVAITKTFEELSNPTIIINDWSKTVSIPFSQRNNEIFGHIYCPDRMTVAGASTIGIYFNPLKKLDFRIEWNSTVLMTGYAKMNEVKQNKGNGSYEITLFGQLGKIFQELQKITFFGGVGENNYYIDGSQYLQENINKSLIYNSWNSSGQTHSRLYTRDNPHYNFTDIIGFAPNNSFNDSFDYKTFQSDIIHSEKFENVLSDTTFSEDTGIQPDTAIPKGMLPREIGEYRSYLQLPFIYWNKLFKIFQEKAESITGYTFDLDSTWFNTSNPYWYNIVYMLKMLDINSGNLYSNVYNQFSTSYYNAGYTTIGSWGTGSGYTTDQTNRLNALGIVSEQINGVLDKTNSRNRYAFGDNKLLNFHYFINLYLWVISQSVHIKNDNGLLLTVTATGTSGATKSQTFLIRNQGSTITYNNVPTFEAGTSGSGATGYDILIPTIDAYFSLSKAEFGDYVIFQTTTKWINNSYPLTGSAQGSLYLYYAGSSQGGTVIGTKSNVEVTIPDTHWLHSNGQFTLNDLWDNDHNLFDEILKYCKMFRIGISVDEFKKKIIFKPYAKYFQDYTVTDWTDKVDKSKDFTITPVTLENKYVLFNYKDSNTKQGKQYKSTYGINYGDYRLVTDYNFNSDTQKLFEDVNASITNTDNILSWTNLFDNHKIVYSFPSELYVYCKDAEDKYVDTFGSFYFHNGLRNFSTEASLNLRDVYISDDTALQNATNKYFYTQMNSEMQLVTTYPNLDIVRGDNLCVFNVPKENYTYINNYSGKQCIYTNLWQKYMNERYNVQNKKITCYVNITPQDYNQFKWNTLVQIGNQLCIVNKIYDYDITAGVPTKVDLITIQDITGYTTNNYTYDWITAEPDLLTIPYDYYKQSTVHSSGPWQVKSDDHTDYLTVFPSSGASGTTNIIIGSIDEDNGYPLTLEVMNEQQTEVLGEAVIDCNVGGTNTISVSKWYNEIPVGGYDYIDITSDSNWLVIAKDNRGGVSVDIGTESGSSGMTRRRMLVSSTSNTGIIDYYLKNNNGDIASFRINVTA